MPGIGRFVGVNGSVASGVSPDVEGGVPPPGTGILNFTASLRRARCPALAAGETPASTANLLRRLGSGRSFNAFVNVHPRLLVLALLIEIGGQRPGIVIEDVD